MTEQLRALGADVTEVVAYRTMAAELATRTMWTATASCSSGRIDAVTFTSGSAIRSFVALFGAEQAVDLLGQTVVATIGPVTADTRALGITPPSCRRLHDPGARRRARRALPRGRGAAR